MWVERACRAAHYTLVKAFYDPDRRPSPILPSDFPVKLGMSNYPALPFSSSPYLAQFRSHSQDVVSHPGHGRGITDRLWKMKDIVRLAD